MDLHIVLVGSTALVCAGLIWLSATAAIGRGIRRCVLLLALLQVALFYVATADLLGRPKPASVELLSGRLQHAEVLAHHLRQGEAIFVWLRPERGGDPLSYSLPWSERTARDLHQAGSEAEERGGSVQLTMPAEDGAEGGEPQVGWTPPQAPPPKRLY